jgi:glycerol-3-phosphate acyltransferase PlsX
MKILIDVMSGDNAPAEIVRGAVLAVKTLQPENEYILVGDSAVVTREVEAAGAGQYLSSKRISVVHADILLQIFNFYFGA